MFQACQKRTTLCAGKKCYVSNKKLQGKSQETDLETKKIDLCLIKLHVYKKVSLITSRLR